MEKYMYSLIDGFANQLREALDIGEKATVEDPGKKLDNVLITGLGGSGIGGKIVSQWVDGDCKVPVVTNNDYTIPGWVDENTLVIANSYSGNTEETLAAMSAAMDRGAEIACVTSGGKMKEIAETKGYNHILVPGGHPPRACLGYALVQQLCLLRGYGLISKDIHREIEGAADLLEEEGKNIEEHAGILAEEMKGKRAVLYAEADYEGVVVRLRQQLNENSKQLCWHHVLPEMNHNELVGWAGGDTGLFVILFRTEDDHPRTQVRMDISKEVWARYCSHVQEEKAMGKNRIERTLYLIHLGDWLSWKLADLNGVDPVEIEVINHLKGELAKL